jgi:hypothetical protein
MRGPRFCFMLNGWTCTGCLGGRSGRLIRRGRCCHSCSPLLPCRPATAWVGKTLVAVGPPNRYEEIAGHANVTLWACRPCVEALGLAAGSLDRRVKPGGMNDFQAAAKGPEAKVVSF